MVMAQWIYSFCSDVIFMIPLWHQQYKQIWFCFFPMLLQVSPRQFTGVLQALLLASEFPTFYERFSWCVWILHLIQWRRYHVFVWHYRSLVSRSPTFASLCFLLHETRVSTYLAIHCHPRSSNLQYVSPSLHPRMCESFWQRRCTSLE